MTARGEWFLTQEELQAPTDDECKAITARVTPAARSRFNEAASALSIAKIKSGDRTPWRELVEAHRKTLPVQVEIEVVNDEGMPRVQVAYIERGYGLKGNDALMFNAVSELARAIELIEDERARNKRNGSIGGPNIKFPPEEIEKSVSRVVGCNPPERLMNHTVGWIAQRVQDDWRREHGPSFPSEATIRPYISAALPAHPGLRSVKKQKT